MATRKAPRYRKVSTRIWADERFRRLSPLPPSGQALWLWLLTGPMTRQVPGLFRAGLAAMEDELGWTRDCLCAAMNELEAQGMLKFDQDARVVWLPNALKHNPPDNPNVVAGWQEELLAIPECALKVEALQSLRAQIAQNGDAWSDAMDQALGRITKRERISRRAARPIGATEATNPLGDGFGDGSGKGFDNGSRKQDQEQDQEQEQEESTPPSATGELSKHLSPPPISGSVSRNGSGRSPRMPGRRSTLPWPGLSGCFQRCGC